MIGRRRLAAGAAIATTTVAVAAGLAMLSAGTPAERDLRWNVVVIVTDDQTFDSIPHDPPVMPYLQRAAADPAEHWVTFSEAFANTPLCCPSRATLLTGRYAHHHGVLTNDDGSVLDEFSTVAAWVDKSGYHTGLVGKYLNGYPFGRAPFVPAGWDRWWAKAQGPVSTLYYGYTLIEQGSPARFGGEEGDYATDVLADRAVEFVREAPPDEPFLLWFAPTAPHPPWVPAPRDEGDLADLPMTPAPSVGELDVTDKPAWVRDLPPLDPSQREALVRAHRRSFETLLAVDDALRAIVAALKERGDLDRTLIVFASDNGYSFGEHRWIAKRCPYEECTRVPLLVRFPPAAGRTDQTPVSTVDLAPTIAELAGIEPPESVDGASLVPLLVGEPLEGAGTVYSEWVGDDDVPAWWQVRTADFAYIELGTGERELYDLRVDPFELENAIADPSRAQVVAGLAAALERFRRS